MTTSKMGRRGVIAGIAAVTVAGFDPVGRTWVAEASAHPGHGIPHLDGQLVFDPSVRDAKSSDAGQIVFQTPFAVLQPGSVEDISKMVKFCKQRKIKVAARGQGHTTFGQSLVDGGLSIDMSFLDQVHSISTDRVDVGAGLRWRELTEMTTAIGLAPPCLTGYIGLSIGGTLSVGGITAGYQRGAQVDHVFELEVVTGEGDIVRCSRHQHSDLFEAVLAGLGQCGIITRAVVELVPRPAMARTYTMVYVDNTTYFADMRVLLARAEFDDIFTLFVPNPAGGWLYLLNGVKYFETGSPPDDANLLRDLHQLPGPPPSDSTFFDFAINVDKVIDLFRTMGLWDNVIHPWFDVFLPGDAVEQYIGEVLPSLTPDDVGQAGFMLLFAEKRSAFHRDFLRLPDNSDCHEQYIFLFDILTAAPAPGPNPEFTAEMLSRNRALFEMARDVGGVRYPIGALEFDKQDWRQHYGSSFHRFKELKHKYDPAKILAPGLGIF